MVLLPRRLVVDFFDLRRPASSHPLRAAVGAVEVASGAGGKPVLAGLETQEVAEFLAGGRVPKADGGYAAVQSRSSAASRAFPLKKKLEGPIIVGILPLASPARNPRTCYAPPGLASTSRHVRSVATLTRRESTGAPPLYSHGRIGQVCVLRSRFLLADSCSFYRRLGAADDASAAAKSARMKA